MNWKRFLVIYEAKMEEAILAGDLDGGFHDPGREQKMLRKRLMQTKKRFQKKHGGQTNHL